MSSYENIELVKKQKQRKTVKMQKNMISRVLMSINRIRMNIKERKQTKNSIKYYMMMNVTKMRIVYNLINIYIFNNKIQKN